ncbi:MAG: sterol desaturase family protein [Ilumatobacteraceae bacterium]|nr:sterol desaturase family protein [Ilumatobacteraceae bacterium]
MRFVMLFALGLLAFVAMEGVSYAAHRWVMHGPGMVWHRSHHAPSTTRLEANDLFPVVFSVIGFGTFLAASLLGSVPLLWVAGGVTAYGLAYAFVHEVYIHRRIGVTVRDRRYLVWMRDSHQIHHALGGEPYGMLFPVVSAARRAEAARREARRTSTRETRSLL